MNQTRSSLLTRIFLCSFFAFSSLNSSNGMASPDCEIAVYLSQFDQCPSDDANRLIQVTNQVLNQKGYRLTSQWNAEFALEIFGARSENFVRVFLSYSSPFPDEGLLPFSFDQTLRGSSDASCIRPLTQTLERLESCTSVRNRLGTSG